MWRREQGRSSAGSSGASSPAGPRWRLRSLRQSATIELDTGVERVQQDFLAAGIGVQRRHAHQKVSRKRDALHFDPGPVRHLHVDQRERDRNAEPSLEDDVQEAVAEVVIVPVVAGKALVLEQQSVERDQSGADRPPGNPAHPCARLGAEPIERLHVRPGVEGGILQPGDDQRGAGQVDGLSSHGRVQFMDQRVFLVGDHSRSITSGQMASSDSTIKSAGASADAG